MQIKQQNSMMISQMNEVMKRNQELLQAVILRSQSTRTCYYCTRI